MAPMLKLYVDKFLCLLLCEITIADNMPALLITSLDRFIEPASSSSEETASSTDQSTPFSFYPPFYATPSQQRPPSPSSFSPSPYVLNFKRRGPVQQQLNVREESPINVSSDLPSQQQLHRMDAIQGEDMTITSVELNQVGNSADLSSNEDGILKRSGEVLSENEVFEMELEKRDASKNVSALGNRGLLNKDEHLYRGFSANVESGIGCEHPTAPSLASSLVMNEELEFFDAPDSDISDFASEDEVCSVTGKPGRWLGGCGGRTTSKLEGEIARRIKAEETVAIWQRRWNEMAKRCASIGLSICSQTGEVLGNSSEVLTQELLVARLVGGAISRAVVRAEKDEEIEGILGVKNREISRLWDKLQYLELVNREMSQRNQEVIELTQRRRKRRQRRQKLALGGFCAAFCIGTVGLVCYKYVPWDHVKGWSNLFEKSSVGDSSSAEGCRK